ncbi:MAG TPA: extradiol dioxygenase, partial [Candidatus Dormibacteraeota bacterium]
FHPIDPDDRERHELYLMCDDIRGTMEQLAERGAEFVAPVTEARFGLLTQIRLPGGSLLGLYEPRHASPLPAFS